jgi:hypothetical protein
MPFCFPAVESGPVTVLPLPRSLMQVSFFVSRSYRNVMLGAITIAGLRVFGSSSPSFPTLEKPLP